MIDIGSQIDDVYCLYLNNILDNESIQSESEYEEILEKHKNERHLYVFERKKISYIGPGRNSLQEISCRKGMESKLTSDPEKGNLFFFCVNLEKEKKELIKGIFKLEEIKEDTYTFKKIKELSLNYFEFLNSKYWILDIGSLWFSSKKFGDRGGIIKFGVVSDLRDEFTKQVEEQDLKFISDSKRDFIKRDSIDQCEKNSDNLQFYNKNGVFNLFISTRFCASELLKPGLYNLDVYNKEVKSNKNYINLKKFLQSKDSEIELESSKDSPVAAIWNLYFSGAQTNYGTGTRSEGLSGEDNLFIEYLTKIKKISHDYAYIFICAFTKQIKGDLISFSNAPESFLNNKTSEPPKEGQTGSVVSNPSSEEQDKTILQEVSNENNKEKNSPETSKIKYKVPEILLIPKNRKAFEDYAIEYLQGGSQAGLTQKNLVEKYYGFLDWVNSGCVIPKDYEYCTGGKAFNQIIFGCPGSGKSTEVNRYCKENNIEITRTTFYEDYSNSDFVGQVIPVVDEDGESKQVSYEFQPGPFSVVLYKALLNKDQKYALVIEEINRGNAPAIFGDIFQLLDRDKNHQSCFEIVNLNIQKYLEKKFNEDTSENCFFDSIKIPSNLYILGTMNVGDQNVFTLDTAFKRRWKFKKLNNTFTSEDKIGESQIPGSKKIKWKNFVETINSYILEYSDGMVSAEDKQLGKWFVEQDLLVTSSEPKESEEQTDEADTTIAEEFSFKIFEYLWDDVAKFNRKKWFNENLRCLDDIIQIYIECYKNTNFDDNLESIFSDEICNALRKTEDAKDVIEINSGNN